LSGLYQGKVSAAGAGVAARQPKAVGKAIILSAMVETYAVLGLLITILLVNGIQVG
jgi:V/A-type H+-transporting ATPase subunit K